MASISATARSGSWTVCGHICADGYGVIVGKCWTLVAFHSLCSGSWCGALFGAVLGIETKDSGGNNRGAHVACTTLLADSVVMSPRKLPSFF